MIFFMRSSSLNVVEQSVYGFVQSMLIKVLFFVYSISLESGNRWYK
jgi:hypothetical protein